MSTAHQTITVKEARALWNDQLDESISALMQENKAISLYTLENEAESETLKILLEERSSRIAAHQRKLQAIDQLWEEFGVDCDDIRMSTGHLSVRMNGHRFWTVGVDNTGRSHEMPEQAVAAMQGDFWHTRRYLGAGDRPFAEHTDCTIFESPEEALLANLRAWLRKISL